MKINKTLPIGLLLTSGLQIIMPPFDEDFDQNFSDENLAKKKPEKVCKVPLRVMEFTKGLLKYSDKHF